MKKTLFAFAVAVGLWLLAATLPVSLSAQPPFLMYGTNGGTPKVVLTNSSGQLQTEVVSTVPGVAATSLGKAEDAALATGDTGIFALGVVDATNSTQRAAAGDYSQITVDEFGVQLVRPDHPRRIHCVVAVSTATALTAVGGSCAAPGASLSIYITDVLFAASASGIAADAFPTLKSGTGGTCGTATTVVWQALTAAAVIAVDNRSTPIKLTVNHELCWISSTAGSKAIQISGFIAP